MSRFDEIYQNTLENILENGIREVNERTGHETATLPGVSFSIDIEKEGFPLLSLRKIPVQMFVAEQVWFIAGLRKPGDFLREYTKIWDGFTNPGDTVTVAYGYRWRHHFGRDQLGDLVQLLENEPSSRHGVVLAWDPGSDGLGGTKRANVPCPFAFTVNIVGGKLHLHNIVRSNDMMLGNPADVAGFALLQCILAQRLGVRPGIYTHSISNAHIYDIHYEAAREVISRKSTQKAITLQLPPNTFIRSEKKDGALVEEIMEDIMKQYTPLDPIKGIKIVL
ncbi:thymidylate synthase [Candidatus Kaiserbacteria bacterium]|nr:thymidylate synthase [Candidatus Kaiserbacteria bacterium]